MKRLLSVILAAVIVLTAVPFSSLIGTGGFSDLFGISSFALNLMTPELVSAKNAAGGVTVKWESVFFASSYNVYRKTAKTKWAKIGNVSETTYLDSSAKSGTTYTYTVRACRGDSISSYDSTGVSVSYLAAPRITSIANAAAGIAVKWEAPDGAATYNVYRKTADTSWKKIAAGSKTGYTDKNVQSGSTYQYTVRAVNGKNMSGYYDGKSLVFLTRPALKSVSNTSAGITVTWGSVKGSNGYNVYRKTTGSWSRIGTSLTTSYTDKNVSKDVTYTYTVRACKGPTLSAYDPNGISVKSAQAMKAAEDNRTIKWYIDETGAITTKGDKGVLGFGYSTSDMCFYATGNAWQRNFGYTKTYDAVSELVAISYDTIRVYFTYDYKDWMIQMWKGQYGFVLEGAEVGVYNKPSKSSLSESFYNCAQDKDRLPISLSLYNSGFKLFSRPAQKSWWMTGFVLGKLGLGAAVTSDFTQLLSATTSITFKDKTMRDAFLKGLQDVKYIENNVDRALDISKGKVLAPGQRPYKFKSGDGTSATVFGGTYRLNDNTVTLSWK